MEEKKLRIVKRDGQIEYFDPLKIKAAIVKAYRASGIQEDLDGIEHIVHEIMLQIEQQSLSEISVEQVQDLVEELLMRLNPFVAKRYIIYREWRTVERDRRSSIKQVMDGIVAIESNDINLGNANMSAHTPAGQMMTIASEIAKDYSSKYLLAPQYSRAHRVGDIHIHDLDYYSSKTTTCVQYDIADLFERGFRSKNGSIRSPQSIHSYATLATIIFQTNQNEQHGGQSIPAFDFFMAPGVRKTFLKHLTEQLQFVVELKNPVDGTCADAIGTALCGLDPQLDDSDAELEKLAKGLADLPLERQEIAYAHRIAMDKTRRDTHQAMEGFIHNLNTMHSRGGNQVVFSSINYGTDHSPAGRMLIEELLRATEEGLGQGEVPIFPIQIFKVKEGVNYSEADYKLAMEHFDDALAGKLSYETPNFDLLIKSCATTAKALFPNFLFLDAPYNVNELWQADDPKRYMHEVATMGCRTRVFDNLNGPKTSIGRGNLSFTSINLPRLAIEARQQAEEFYPGANKHIIRAEAKKFLKASLRQMGELVAEQLYDRYCYQRTALARQFPFMMSNDVWKGGMQLGANDKVGDVIMSGTLGIGFIGGHNAMVAIYGEGHGESQEAWQCLYELLEDLNQLVADYKQKYGLNYAVLATPAEGLSGRFTRMDRKRYGTIAGVTDRDYYVNSFHIDVREQISMADKIKKEAPFHALCLGGHITYVELDGEAKKNVSVVLKIVKLMKDTGIGYGSINHPVDTCKNCSYKGIIYDKCPLCKSDQIARLRRITGYLTGSLESWNSAKQAEESDRIKHA